MESSRRNSEPDATLAMAVSISCHPKIQAWLAQSEVQRKPRVVAMASILLSEKTNGHAWSVSIVVNDFIFLSDVSIGWAAKVGFGYREIHVGIFWRLGGLLLSCFPSFCFPAYFGIPVPQL